MQRACSIVTTTAVDGRVSTTEAGNRLFSGRPVGMDPDSKGDCMKADRIVEAIDEMEESEGLRAIVVAAMDRALTAGGQPFMREVLVALDQTSDHATDEWAATFEDHEKAS
jgi:hypothetical protein